VKPIYASRNSLVGSIGVIFSHYSFEGLSKKVGVKDDHIAIGKYKREALTFKDISSEAREYIKEYVLMPSYENFISDVALNRGIPKEKIKEFADGKIYVANDPRIKDILVDEIATFYEIKDMIKSRYPADNFKFIYVNGENGAGQNSSFFNFNIKLDIDIKDALRSIKEFGDL
jgi:protease-4